MTAAHLAYSSDGARLVITGFDAVQVWVTRVRTLHVKLDHSSDVGRGPRGAAFVSAGLLVAVSCRIALHPVFGVELLASGCTPRA